MPYTFARTTDTDWRAHVERGKVIRNGGLRFAATASYVRPDQCGYHRRYTRNKNRLRSLSDNNGLSPTCGRRRKELIVSKLNEDGTYAWAYQFGGGYDETVIGMDIDSDNNLYVMGTFYGTVDFDPDPVDTDVRVSTELFGLYLVSFTPDGDFRWVHTWTGGMFKDTGGIRIDDLNNIVMTGSYKGLVDFDPGTGTQDYGSVAGEWDLFVLKLKATTYEFDWVASIGVMAAETDDPLTSTIKAVYMSPVNSPTQ